MISKNQRRKNHGGTSGWKRKAAVLILSGALMLPAAAAAETGMDSGMNQIGTRTINGMEYVPLWKAAEQAGYKVMWNAEDKSVTLTRGDMMMDSMEDMDAMNGMDSMDDMNSMNEMDGMDSMNGMDSGGMEDHSMDSMDDMGSMEDRESMGDMDGMDGMNGMEDGMSDMESMDGMNDMGDMNMMTVNTLKVMIGSTHIWVNDERTSVMYAPILVDNMTYVPKAFANQYLMK